MVPCGIAWCVATTDKQFCALHEKDQSLRPRRIDHDEEIDDAYNQGHAEGFAAAVEDSKDRHD